MKIFNKRNALVGFLTLKWLEQRRRRRKRHALRFAVLGILSLGIVAALGAVLVKRQRGEERFEGEDEIVGEAVISEPFPAT